MATETKRKRISIVIPALNEEQGIANTINTIPNGKLQDMNYDVEIIVVDNGSTDKTSEIAKRAGAAVVYEPVRGYGKAYKTGFSSAIGEIIATADADCTYPVEDIPKLVKALEDEGLDFITTNRFADMTEDAMHMQNRFGNLVLNITTKLLYGINLNDSQSGMWVFRKNLLQEFKLRSNGMPLSEELKIEACYYTRCRWKELPISYKARMGKVKLRTFRDGFENLFYLIRKRFIR
ncbi:MAG: glycosyltransferase family 2 protein [Dehalococcoidia bacterium]